MIPTALKRITPVCVIILLTQLMPAQLTGPIPGMDNSADYFVYYGDFNDDVIAQSQYYDMLIISVNGISPEEVQDIRNGFDDLSGTEDDVIVIGYISVGEAHQNNIVGDGSGPCFWNGSQIIYEHYGVASFYLDDLDYNGIPDENQTWNSYYVNAGDPNWWAYNAAVADDILITHGCDGLFLDTVDTASPEEWGNPYSWTSPGMADYIAHLRSTYAEKYIIMNRGMFYFHPDLSTYAQVDEVRNSINGLMFENYYTTWNWNTDVGEISAHFNNNLTEWAPRLNTQATLEDGFTIVALDYLNPDQPNYQSMLETQIQLTEGDQGWTTAISTVLLDEIRWDVYHNHLEDNNAPTWENRIGILAFERQGANLRLFWNPALDQSPPLSYHLYLTDTDVNFDAAAQYPDLTAETSILPNFEYQFDISDLDPEQVYQAGLRAADSTPAQFLDQNRVIITVPADTSAYGTTIIDGIFDDWVSAVQLDGPGGIPETAGDGLVPEVDLLDLWVQDDALNVFVSFSTAGPIGEGYFYHVFLDTDNDPGTGYHSNDSFIGIDLMVENGFLWQYTGSAGEWSWAFLGETPWEVGQLDPARIELAVDRNLFPAGGESIQLLFNVNDLNDAVDDDFAPDNFLETGYLYPPAGGECLAGDVNEDEAVDILDIVVLVGYIISGLTLEGCGPEAGDVNDDGGIDVLDIVVLVDWILN